MVRNSPRKQEQRQNRSRSAISKALVTKHENTPIDPAQRYHDLLTEIGERNPRHRRFIEEYILDFNGAEAIRRAGFNASLTGTSASVYAHSLLKRPKVAEAVRLAQDAFSARSLITRERIEQELANLAFSNAEDYITIDTHGNPAISLALLTRDKAAAIQEITVTRGKKGKRTVKVKLYDKRASLNDLAKLKGFTTDANDRPNEFTFQVFIDGKPRDEVEPTEGDFREINE